MVNRRSDTDLGNMQSAPRGGGRATVYYSCLARFMNTLTLNMYGFLSYLG